MECCQEIFWRWIVGTKVSALVGIYVSVNRISQQLKYWKLRKFYSDWMLSHIINGYISNHEKKNTS